MITTVSGLTDKQVSALRRLAERADGQAQYPRIIRIDTAYTAPSAETGGPNRTVDFDGDPGQVNKSLQLIIKEVETFEPGDKIPLNTVRRKIYLAIEGYGQLPSNWHGVRELTSHVTVRRHALDPQLEAVVLSLGHRNFNALQILQMRGQVNALLEDIASLETLLEDRNRRCFEDLPPGYAIDQESYEWHIVQVSPEQADDGTPTA